MKKSKFIYSFAFTLLLVFALFILNKCNPPAEKAPEQTAAMTPEQQVERGHYLVTVLGCSDCHTPKKFTDKGPVLNEDLMLSGYAHDEKLPDIDPSEIKPGKWYLGSSGMNAWVGPWGVSFAANLTPDTLTGSGAWTEELFLKIIRSGKFMGSDAGRPIMPPMPWQNYSQMTDDDLKSIFAYLRTLKPISNSVPAYISQDMLPGKK